jgi:ubiquinone biosynthesis protein UbiJ
MMMRLPFPLPQPQDLLLKGLNALLRREPWACERLAAQAGKSLRLSVGEQAGVQLTIGSDGLLRVCDAAIVPDVILSIPAGRLRELPAAWRAQGLSGVTGLAHIQGDAGLAHLVSELARSLRWDVEDDLSRLVGDVLAVRLVRGGRLLASGLHETARRARGNLAEYLGEESGLGVGVADVQDWSRERQVLEDRLARLEARLGRLEGAC